MATPPLPDEQPATSARSDAQSRRDPTVIVFLALLLQSALIMAVGWHHSLLDSHGFRQTQTAITVDALLKGSPWLAYETPVFGPPWSVPFEFPLYQWLVALAVKISGASIESAGRAVAVAFFYLSLFPTNAILRRSGLAAAERRIALSLLLASPLYLFYSRTVMIESVALFLGLAYLAAVAEYVAAPRWVPVAAGAVVGALGASVKITTFLAFGLAAAAWLLIDIRRQRVRGDRPVAVAKSAVPAAVAFGLVPFVCLSLWTRFADAHKRLNPLTAHFLTSDSLSAWNFGPLSLRLTSAFWWETMHRTFTDAIGGPPVALAALVLLRWVPRRHRLGFGACLALYLIGTLVFANLHVVHAYYPYGNALFLVAGVGWVVIGLRANGRHRLAAALFVVTVAAGEVVYFGKYFPLASHDVHLPLADELQRLTRPDDVLLIYGLDWSPETAFYSHRRALMDRNDLSLDSSEMRTAFKELSDRHLTIGATVTCGDFLVTSDFVQDVVTRLGFVRARMHEVPGCLVYVPRDAPS
jgi:hypothetical protein